MPCPRSKCRGTIFSRRGNKENTYILHFKQWLWEAVVLLPFIDSKPLLQRDKAVSHPKKWRGKANCLIRCRRARPNVYVPHSTHAGKTSLQARAYLPGFPALHGGTLAVMCCRLLRVNIHISQSRCNTARRDARWEFHVASCTAQASNLYMVLRHCL
jgi:hypothetical protein